MEFGSYYAFSCPNERGIEPLSIDMKNLGLGKQVNNLLIYRKGYGKIMFIGKTKINSVDVEKYIRINSSSVEVYPNGDEPPIGKGLNKPAIISLYNVFPRRKQNILSFILKLRRATNMMGAKFISYNSQLGLWIFIVKHFSKYGLNDSDEELEIVNVTEANKQTEPKTMAVLNTKKATQDERSVDPKIQEGTEKEMMDVEKSKEAECFESSDTDLLNTSMPSDIMEEVDDFSVNDVPNSVMKSLDTERIQSMKSSLFHDDHFDIPIDYVEDINALIPTNVKRPKPTPATKETLLPQHVIVRKARERVLPMSTDLIDHYKILPSGMPDRSWLALDNLGLARSQFHLGRSLNFRNSVLFDRQHMLADSGLFMGKSFRIGWGSKMKLAYQGNLGEKPTKFFLNDFHLMSVSSQPKATSNFCVNISKLESNSQDATSSIFINNITKNLKVQLMNRSLSVENETPFFKPNIGVEMLHSHATLAEEEANNFGQSLSSLIDSKHIWDLCVALWGNIPLGNTGENTYNLRYDRKTAFSKWLMDSTKFKLLQETQNSNHFDYLSVLFSYLAGHQIFEACNLAVQHGDYRLGLLLGNATSTYNRAFLVKQLENWQDMRAHEYIDKRRLKIFALLAGCLIWNLDPDISVNCCENLDWKRVLAVHTWYHCPSTSDICDAVREYEKSFLGTSTHGKYSQPPYPAYIENDPELLMNMCVDELDNISDTRAKPYDVCYHLLKLYCDRSMRLDRLLSTQSYSLSHLDYGMSWFLHQVLESLGYNHLPLLQSQQLYENFASQLEALGLWEWSIFVLLHTKNCTHRKSAVMNYLIRYVSFSTDDDDYIEKESFIMEELRIPKQWIFFAKSILSRSLGSHKDEAWCLLKSENWSQSHRIIIQHIAPDCIISENFDYLKDFLLELSQPNVSVTISEWRNGGEVCLDYIMISEAVDKVLKGQVQAYDLEELQPRLVSLSKRICNLQCTNAKETLCQSEMAKKTVTLLRAVLMLQKAKNNGQPADHLLAPYLSKLPMPEDYALQELRTMTRAYRLELTNN